MYSTHPPGSHDELPVILCVSEDKTFLNTTRASLGYAGFVAVATSSAAEASELIGETAIDAVICDYELSQIDGIAFFEAVAAGRGDQTPPTLIVGDHYSAPLLARCLQAGTAGLHSKSDPIESLIERVISIIRDDTKRARVEALSRRAPAMPVPPPELDHDGVLRFDGRWVAIPPVEARLVEALVGRIDAVVSRDELARAGWPGGSPGRNALDVHMLRLRRRIEPLGLQIRTADLDGDGRTDIVVAGKDGTQILFNQGSHIPER